MSNEEWIEIGTVVAPHALDGAVRVYPNTDFPERFLEPGKRWLQQGDREPEPVELLGGRYIPGKGLYVVKLAGIEYRDQAEALRDAKLLVPESDRPTLEEDEYHVRDLLKLEVFNQLTGEAIGVVVDIIPAGNDLLEVQLHKQPELPSEKSNAPIPNRKSKIRKKRPKPGKPVTVLIPFVKEIVPVVDLKNRRMEIAPPPGLL
ncbi:MAG: ribosome maturation factor RimM [Hormoscilla sp. SP12CHS1]|nr:ribosome maturation factor RimM [Hormoscilla sp. SP12CHS1]